MNYIICKCAIHCKLLIIVRVVQMWWVGLTNELSKLDAELELNITSAICNRHTHARKLLCKLLTVRQGMSSFINTELNEIELWAKSNNLY